MAHELVRFTSTNLQLQFGKKVGMPAIIAFLAGWILGEISVGIFWAVATLVIGGLVLFVKHNKAIYEAACTAARSDLSTRGYNVDFQVGTALIDSKSKIIAFVDLANKSYDLYGARDILGWEHQWVDKTTATTNAWGNQSSATTRQTNNAIVFKTNNPAKPLYKVPVISHRDGEEWMARLGAIINS